MTDIWGAQSQQYLTADDQERPVTLFGIPVIEVAGMDSPALVASDWSSYIILRDGETEEIFSLEQIQAIVLKLGAKRVENANA